MPLHPTLYLRNIVLICIKKFQMHIQNLVKRLRCQCLLQEVLVDNWHYFCFIVSVKKYDLEIDKSLSALTNRYTLFLIR